MDHLNLGLLVLSLLTLILSAIAYKLHCYVNSLNSELSKLVREHTTQAIEHDHLKIAHKKILEELIMLKSLPKKETYEVSELMADLLDGRALVELKRIDPASVFLRSIKE